MAVLVGALSFTEPSEYGEICFSVQLCLLREGLGDFSWRLPGLQFKRRFLSESAVVNLV